MDSLSENPSTPTIPPASPTGRRSTAAFSRNAAAGLVRLLVHSLIGLVVPAYLTRHLPVKTFGAWVLILQLSAYVSYLDFGVQTGIAKYVAEYEAKADHKATKRCVSAGLAILLVAGVLGLLLTLMLAWRVPQLFRDMPASLCRDVRISVVLIGISLSLGLPTSAFSGIFLGLQRYAVPMSISVINRLLFVAVVCWAVSLHRGLAVMGATAAAVNVLTTLLQIVAWRALAGGIRPSLSSIDRNMLKRMLEYCLVLAIWSGSMLCINGLDITIVGHYAFTETGFYSIAAAPTNLIVAVWAAILGPLIPAASALSAQRTAVDMGRILSRVTRYATFMLFLSGLPLLVGGYAALRLWLGSAYALHGVRYLRILVLANILRNLCAPYATMVVATGKQKVATAAAISEALVNLTSSLYLASRLGAMGVALGTLLGAVVSVSMHFALSMRYTYKTLAISRSHLLLKGILRPSIIAIPSVLLLPFWWSSVVPSLDFQIWLIWALSTVLLLWFGSLTAEERNYLTMLVKGERKLLVKPN